jgi:hypothetical protein
LICHLKLLVISQERHIPIPAFSLCLIATIPWCLGHRVDCNPDLVFGRKRFRTIDAIPVLDLEFPYTAADHRCVRQPNTRWQGQLIIPARMIVGNCGPNKKGKY